jgi:hypothetical protein
MAATALAPQNMVVLKTALLPPVLAGTSVPISVPNLEPPLRGKRSDFYVPVGTVNLARGKKVIASDNNPDVGTLDMITDGDKAGDESSWLELGPGKQWMQIDLSKNASIYAVIDWHSHSQVRVYRDVAVQVSDEPTFRTEVAAIFNND